MSAVELLNFEKQINSFSYAEQLIAMKMILSAMEKRQKEIEQSENEKTEFELSQIRKSGYSTIMELSKSERIKKINETLAKIPQEEQLSYCDVGIESVREALKNDAW